MTGVAGKTVYWSNVTNVRRVVRQLLWAINGVDPADVVRDLPSDGLLDLYLDDALLEALASKGGGYRTITECRMGRSQERQTAQAMMRQELDRYLRVRARSFSELTAAVAEFRSSGENAEELLSTPGMPPEWVQAHAVDGTII